MLLQHATTTCDYIPLILYTAIFFHSYFICFVFCQTNNNSFIETSLISRMNSATSQFQGLRFNLELAGYCSVSQVLHVVCLFNYFKRLYLNKNSALL